MGILSGIIGNAGVIKAEELEYSYGTLLTDAESLETGFKVQRKLLSIPIRDLL